MKYLSFYALIVVLILTNCGQRERYQDLAKTNQQLVDEINREANDLILHPNWSKNATIYEVNVRQYTPEGTFNAFRKHLPRLKELGVDILWFMPIHEIGLKNRKSTESDMGNYHSVKNYTSINPDFGTKEDFKKLVNECHAMGFKVLLDWVANHSAWDNPWAENKDWYELDSTGNFISPFDWADVIAFNYENQNMQKAMIDAMSYWIKEFDVDGYRCHVAFLVPTDFWEKAVSELKKIKDVFMLAEAEHFENKLQEKAFNMSYAWEYHHIINEIVKGHKSLSAIDTLMIKEDSTFKTLGAYRMYFTTNHDENSWNGTVFEQFKKGHQAFAVLSFTIDGMPLIYSGQEAGLHKRLRFFEKDTINWDDLSLTPFYQALIKLNKENKALWNGRFGGDFKRITLDDDHVYAFTRTKDDNQVFTVINLSDKEITLANSKVQGNFTELFSGQKIEFNSNNNSIHLKPWGYKVYHR